MAWLEAPILLLLAGCGQPAPERIEPSAAVVEPSASQPDLVLLLVGGLRARSAKAYDRAVEAFVSGLGPASVLQFTDAYAQSSSQFVSLASILGGRYASAIPICGLFSGGIKGALQPAVQEHAVRNRAWCAEMPAEVRTLPEVLGIYGYSTGLVSSGLVGASLVTRGFADRHEAPFENPGGTDWPAIEDWSASWWSAHEGGPRLLVVVTADLQIPDRPDLRQEMGFHPEIRDVVNIGPSNVDPARVARVYDEAALEVGTHMASLLGRLDPGRDARPRWTFVAGTNGISLAEEGGFVQMAVPFVTTGYALDRTVHVPLLVIGPPDSPVGRVPRIVELLDILPTMTRLAGATAPAGLPGQDLLQVGTESLAASTAYAEFGDSIILRKGRFLLGYRAFLHNGTVMDPQVDERLVEANLDKEFIYFSLSDVVEDPDQARNLARDERRLVDEMRSEMIRIRQGAAAPPAGTWDDPRRLWDLRMSRSQGYW